MLYAADAFGNFERKMGRQQAGHGILAALIRSTKSSHFPFVAARQEDLAGLRKQVQKLKPDLSLHLWPLDKLDRLSGVDALFVADPVLACWAEARQWHQKGAAAWSLIGLTHTLSSLGALEALRSLPASPLRAWDALICTSRCAREAVQVGLAHQAELLASRFGGQARVWEGPQLYDWNHVVGEIRSLAADLTEKRIAASGQNDDQGSFPSPWQQFASWPSRHHSLAGNICLDPERLQQRLVLMEQLQIYARFSIAADPPLRLSALRSLVAHLLTLAATKRQPFVVSIDALQVALPDQTSAALQQALAWLAKIGALELPA